MKEYKRLTKSYKGAPLHTDMEVTDGDEIYERLAEYEDDEESGKIVRLPCKVGDTVYVISNVLTLSIIETTIDKIVITKNGLRLKLARNSFYETAISSLGERLFLTREEAKKRLKELQNGK